MAKDMVQALRDLSHSIITTGQTNEESLTAAAREQAAAITEGTRIGGGLGTRIATVFNILSVGGPNGNWDTLNGKAPGRYDFAVDPMDSNNRLLTFTGAATDNKTWVVTSKVSGTTLNDVLTISTTNPIPTFKIAPQAGTYTVSATGPDTKLNWSATLAFTLNSNNNPVKADLNLTGNDPSLSTPIHLVGSISGTILGTQTSANGNWPAYHDLTMSGNLTSQFLNGSIGSLKVQWVSSNLADPLNIQSITLSNLTATTQFSKQATLNIPSAVVTFDPPVTAHHSPILKSISFSSSQTASGHSLTFTNATMSTVYAGSEIFVLPIILPKTITGSMTYTSPSTTLTGSLNANWVNPVLLNNLSDYKKTINFPNGSIHLSGTLTPQYGQKSALDVTLTSNTEGSQPAITLALANLAYGTFTLNGTLTQPLSTEGTTISASGPPTATIQSSNGLQLLMSGTVNNLGGGITHNNVKLADIGRADKLGMPDLGGVTIIKYNDGTFETAISILQ